MSLLRTTAFAVALNLSPLIGTAVAQESNTDFVVKAVTELFSNKDLTAIDRYWAESYMQPNPAWPRPVPS